MNKSTSGLGLLAVLLASPVLLLICVVIGIVLIAIALITLVIYGLVTAVVLFCITGLGIVLLQYIKLIDLSKHPWILLFPFIMFAIGYFTEHFRLFSINPLYPSGVVGGQQVTVTLFEAPAQLILLIVIVALAIVALAAIIKRRR